MNQPRDPESNRTRPLRPPTGGRPVPRAAETRIVPNAIRPRPPSDPAGLRPGQTKRPRPTGESGVLRAAESGRQKAASERRPAAAPLPAPPASKHPELITDNDFPCQEDRLGFVKRAQSLLQLLERIEPPMTVLVDGSAGSGRSSYLQFLSLLSEQGEELCPIWVNAVTYNDHRTMFPAILNQIIRDQPPHAALTDYVCRFTEAYHATLDSRELLAGSREALPSREQRKDRVESILSEAPRGMDLYMSVEGLQELWLNAINGALGLARRRAFLCCIDDLDSCTPGAVERLLADIFTYTAIPGSRVIWVLALDRSRYADLPRLRDDGALLGKVANLVVRVPEPTEGCRALVSAHIESLGIASARTIADNVARIIDGCELRNPRQIKRVASRITYIRGFGSYPRVQAEADLLVALLVLLEIAPDFAGRLGEDPVGALQVLQSVNNGSGSSNFGAITLQPMLKSIPGEYAELCRRRDFQRTLVEAGQAAATAFGLRSGNVAESMPRFSQLFRSAQEIF